MHYEPPNALLELDTQKLWDEAGMLTAGLFIPTGPAHKLALALAKNTEEVTLTLTAAEARTLFAVLNEKAKVGGSAGNRASRRKFRRQNRK